MYCKLSLRDVRAVMRTPGPSISLLSHIISSPSSPVSPHYHSLHHRKINFYPAVYILFYSVESTNFSSLGNRFVGNKISP